MRQHLSRAALEKILQATDIAKLSDQELVALFRDEIETDHRPLDLVRVDPRSGDRVVYSTARSVRPHDYPEGEKDKAQKEQDCIICQGKTTGVIDIAELSEGFTFINKNLFPAFYPFNSEGASGLHLLQWTSSYHDVDWHNLNLEDASVVMSRLAALEGSLLSVSLSAAGGASPHFVSIIKNYGTAVGSSLSHGHQQIVLTNVQPSSVTANLNFQSARAETFADYMLRVTPEELILKDYGPAVLLVPDFMRRPYVMMLVVKDTGKAYLHELSTGEIEAVAHGWHDAARSYHDLMPRIDKEIAYNVLTHNGTGAGLYFEFLPYTQVLGGLERMGIYICTERPEIAARRLREVLDKDEDK
jgi:galactose-1-phosphate uridylyltransferase